MRSSSLQNHRQIPLVLFNLFCALLLQPPLRILIRTRVESNAVSAPADEDEVVDPDEEVRWVTLVSSGDAVAQDEEVWWATRASSGDAVAADADILYYKWATL